MAQATISFIPSSSQTKHIPRLPRMINHFNVVGLAALAPCRRSFVKPMMCATKQIITHLVPPKEDNGVTFLKPTKGPVEKILVKKNPPVLVRPATKTDNGLYYLSTFDHNVMHPIAAIYSYKASGMYNTDNTFEVIKKGLAEILIHYYPVAGKLIMTESEKYMVDCTGEGVYFVEAFADKDLDEFGDISMPNAPKIRPLLHFHEADNILDMPLLTVQVTKFNCGGFIIGLRFNHCMADGACMHLFMTSWAELAKGLPLSVPPYLDRSIMKPREFSEEEIASHLSNKFDGLFYEQYKASGAIVEQNDEKVCTLVHFDLEKLMGLKRIVIEEGIEKLPTKFELVTAFLWRAIVRSTKVEEGQCSKLLLPVNLRHTLGTRIPKGYFGNGIGVVYNGWNTEEQLAESSLSAVVEKVQETIQLATTEYLQAFFGCIEAKGLQLSYQNGLLFTDLSRMFFYKADFGWGDPEQVQVLNLRQNVVYFLPQKEKEMKGTVTALVGLPPSAMEIFKKSMS